MHSANHLRSLSNIDSPTDGNRVRTKRRVSLGAHTITERDVLRSDSLAGGQPRR